MTVTEQIERELRAVMNRLSNGPPPDQRQAKRLLQWLADDDPQVHAAVVVAARSIANSRIGVRLRVKATGRPEGG